MGACFGLLSLPSRVATLEARVAELEDRLEARVAELEDRQEVVERRFEEAMDESLHYVSGMDDLRSDVRYLYEVREPEQA